MLLLFTGLHGLYVAQSALTPELSLAVRPVFEASTVQVFVVGVAYIFIVTLGAMFLAHRAVGPVGRLENEVRSVLATGELTRLLKIRDGDEMAGLADAINKLIEKKT